jgi:hypothetical protein
MKTNDVLQKRLLFTFLMVLSLLVRGNADQEDLESKISELRQNIKARKIKSLEIFYIPPGIHFRVAVKPQYLEKNYYYRLTIQQPDRPEQVTHLLSALIKLKITSTAKDADLRWGFVFLDANGDRLASLYANEAVTVGLLDNDRCEFGVELHDILQNSFAKLFD